LSPRETRSWKEGKEKQGEKEEAAAKGTQVIFKKSFIHVFGGSLQVKT